MGFSEQFVGKCKGLRRDWPLRGFKADLEGVLGVGVVGIVGEIGETVCITVKLVQQPKSNAQLYGLPEN
jgi:hypothetical protein